jgi:hypothetical protein
MDELLVRLLWLKRRRGQCEVRHDKSLFDDGGSEDIYSKKTKRKAWAMMCVSELGEKTETELEKKGSRVTCGGAKKKLEEQRATGVVSLLHTAVDKKR